MFEIQDEKIGKLRIFNVTEARANFADVLKEKDAKVVVTRHGRPTKIFINYDEYLALLTQATAAETASKEAAEKHTAALVEETDLNPEISQQKPLPPKWVQREADQIVNSLVGMLNK